MSQIATDTFDGSGRQVAIEPPTFAVALPTDTETLHRVETRRNVVEIFLIKNKFAHTVYVILPYGV